MAKQQEKNIENTKKENSPDKGGAEPNEFSFKKEIQIGVLAIVAGLGFFKVEDLKSFIDVIAQLIVNDIANKEKHDISVYLLAGVSTLAYLFYFFGFGAALMAMFQNNKNFAKAILVSIASYFIMYFFLVILIFKGPYITTMSESIDTLPKKEQTIIPNDNATSFPKDTQQLSKDTSSWKK